MLSYTTNALRVLAVVAVFTLTMPSRAEPVRLVFSIDQGFGNGIVVNRDTAAVERIAAAIKPLRPQYRVYALLNPQLRNRADLDAVAETCVRCDLPIVLDVCSSDALTLGTSTAFNAPADGPHGITITVEDLAGYRRKLGSRLAGIRVMEPFSMDFTLQAIRTTNPEWKGKNWVLPADDFWQAGLIRPYLQFARDHEMFVQFSDWHWSRFAPWDGRQAAREQGLRELLREFPGLITVTYANNQPEEKAALWLQNWHEAFRPFVSDGAKDFGLSDQSWLRNDEMRCPPEDIVAWARRALELNCRLIQFEPVWYFFKLPRGSFGRSDYTKDRQWHDAGAPTPAFRVLRDALLRERITTSKPSR